MIISLSKSESWMTSEHEGYISCPSYKTHTYIYIITISVWPQDYNGYSALYTQIYSGTVLSTELLTVDHHDSIKLSVRWCVWKVGEGFPDRVSPKTLKWVAVYSSVTFHING